LGLLEGQVNEHTGNLGGELLGAQLSDEVENGVSDLSLEMRVLSLDGRNDLQGVGVVSLGLRVLVRGTHLLLVLHRHVHLRHGHGVRLSLLTTSHVHVHTTAGRVVAVTVHHVVATVGAHVAVLSLLSIVRSLAAVVAVVVSSLVVSLLSTVVSTALLERVESLSLHGEGLEELSDLVVELISGRDVLPVVVLVVQLLELLESEFILGLFVLDVSEFLELVMADLELTAVEHAVVHVLESLLSLVGSLEADESVGLLGLVDGEHLDALNFSVVLEHLAEVLIGALGVKVLDVEVASLLGVLVLDGLSEELFLSLGGSKSGLDVKDFTVTHVTSV